MRAKLSQSGADFQVVEMSLSVVLRCWHKEGSIFPIDRDYFCQEQHSWAYLKAMLINVRHCGYPSPLPSNKVLTAPLLN